VNRNREVLVLAPLGRDAESALGLIERHGLPGRAVASIAELASQLSDSTGAVLMTEEAVFRTDTTPLVEALARQPSWSDIPFLFLMAQRSDPIPIKGSGTPVPIGTANVITLEKPLSSVSLLSALDWAMAARRRQFLVRDQILQLEERAEQLRQATVQLSANEAALRNLAETLEARVEERTHALMEMEASLRQAQKMEAVGQLTGGIAHDFNNMLTGIIGSLDMMKRRIASGRTADLDRFMDAASTSAQRAAALTHRLLAFSRRQSLESRPIDVNELVDGMHDLLSRTMSERVSVAVALAPDLPKARADSNQLENALLNLAINARDAMPDGGQLTIETGVAVLDEAYAGRQPDLKPGQYVMLAVSDTGVGMPKSVLEKVFDPFFTTKPAGQGTGLGLSKIYGIARQTGGHIRIHSNPGQGTSVKLYLPLAEEEAVPLGADERAAPHGDGQTVLVVEDDPSVRILVLEVLSELGYRSIEAPDARVAIPILQSAQPIDLLISDVGLPGMNGRQLADIAREARPGLRVLFVTGYAENATERAGFLAEGMDMMTKPFALEKLALKIADIMAQSAAGKDR
jgi:signal transduction histidine kinase/ActR/RegA family two-component response regulator